MIGRARSLFAVWLCFFFIHCLRLRGLASVPTDTGGYVVWRLLVDINLLVQDAVVFVSRVKRRPTMPEVSGGSILHTLLAKVDSILVSDLLETLVAVPI